MGMIRDAIEAKGLTVNAVSRICEVSERLIRMLDAGHVTHPRIAHRIARALDLTEEQEESLKPEGHRYKPVPEQVKKPEPLTRPVGKRSVGRPKDYGKKNTVYINDEALRKLMRQRSTNAAKISRDLDHGEAWMAYCLNTGRMHRQDAEKVAGMLRVNIMDIIDRRE